MTLDEAIKHAEEVAENKEKAIKLAKGNPDHPMLSMSEKEIKKYKQCITEHRQLAEWLTDYKRLKERESCDAISRQAVINAIANTCFWLSADNWKELTKCINSISPVNPQPKTGHCKDCKHFEYDSMANVDGIPLIVAHEICSKWGTGCKTKEDGYCFLFEPYERSNKE